MNFNKILIFGDSITYGKWDALGGWATRIRKFIDDKYNINGDKNIQVYNLGIPGEVAVRLVDRIEDELRMRISKEDKTVIIFAVGINDTGKQNWMTGKQTSEKDFVNALEKLTEFSREYTEDTVFIGLTPIDEEKTDKYFENSEIKRFDELIQKFTDRNNLRYLNLYTGLNNRKFLDTLNDGIHPNTEGHRIMYEVIMKYLEKSGLMN